ncbi:MAG: intradiol ring-cleavage dioxygenase, partial [Rubrivivax sp.]
AAPAVAQRRPALAAMTDGPFYPPARWRERWSDWDADLVHVQRDGRTLTARGEHLALALQVADGDGRAIDGAEIEIWQCDALAAYRHPRVVTTAEGFDPGFQGFGSLRSARDGSARFLTIKPVPYPGRTPHIHLKLRHASFGELTTQLFVAGDPGNDGDFLWRSLQPADRAALAMALRPGRDGPRWQVQQLLTVPA